MTDKKAANFITPCAALWKAKKGTVSGKKRFERTGEGNGKQKTEEWAGNEQG